MSAVKSKISLFRRVINFLHLWLGLITGSVLIIMAITGAVYCFQPELSLATQPHLKVTPSNQPYLPVTTLRDIAAKAVPDKKPSRILYKGNDRSVIVQFNAKKPTPYAWAVYINPYTGEVLAVKNMYNDFFRFMLNGHMYLWLPQDIGHMVTGSSTVIFLLIIISGIIMWWPRNKARRKSSFKVKWNASPKRLNYDLHNVFGFYASWIIIFAVLTGLVWSFDWAANAEHWALSGGHPKPALPKPLSKKITDTNSRKPLDRIFDKVTAAYPTAAGYQLNFPATDSAAVLVRAYPDKDTYYQMDNLYFDQYSTAEIPVSYYGKYADASAAEKATRMNFDIHTGAIAGLPGRFLMFFAALVIASLPITGFLIWRGKKKKAAKPKIATAKAPRTQPQPAPVLEPQHI